MMEAARARICLMKRLWSANAYSIVSVCQPHSFTHVNEPRLHELPVSQNRLPATTSQHGCPTAPHLQVPLMQTAIVSPSDSLSQVLPAQHG